MGAAEVWPIAHLRNSIVAALGSLKAEICVGVIEEDSSPGASAGRLVQEAGFDHYLSTAALEKCAGDPAQALELLARGCTPEDLDTLSMPGSMTSVGSFDGPRCPFARTGADLPAGHPPAMPSATSPPSASDPLANAARVLAEKGMTAEQIASSLGLDEDAVEAAVAQVSAEHGRVLGNRNQQRLDGLTEEDPELCCPVSLTLFVDPVIASDGFMYEKASIEGLLRANMVSPMTRETLTNDYIPAKQRKSAVIEFRQKRAAELVKFAEEAVSVHPQMATAALQRVSDYLEVLKPSQVPA